jgi:adenylosuccinate synthase
MPIEKADIVCGLAWGDEAKGKIVCSLLESKQTEYNWVCRWSGGSNAGHTIWKNNIKYVTHIIPAGIFYGINCYIGPECYVNIDDLVDELNYVKKHGFDTNLLHISPNSHIITEMHKEEDRKYYTKQQGSTGKGIALCARDKYARKGILICNYNQSERLLEFNPNIFLETSKLNGTILCEGAQGVWLDINKGNYPYVTSSLTLPYSACSLGFPPQKIRNIYGAAKIYDTRVGVDPFFPESLTEDNDLSKIAELGNEFGSTTNRLRKTNWLNLDKLIESVLITGTTDIIISKVDVLKQLGKFKLIHNHKNIEFKTSQELCNYIHKQITAECSLIKKIIFSETARNISI